MGLKEISVLTLSQAGSAEHSPTIPQDTNATVYGSCGEAWKLKTE